MSLSRAQANLNTLGHVVKRLSVDVVVAVVVNRASVESGIAIVLDLTRGSNRETSSGGSTLIALELGGVGENTSSATLVGNLAIVDAVGSTRLVRTEAVLAIAKLTKRTTLDTIARDVDAKAA